MFRLTGVIINQANLEPLNILEFLIKVLYVSKAADRCVISEKLLTPAGSESCTKTEGHPLFTRGSAAFETKRTVSKN
jgi:hypothetical protein